MTYGQRDSGDDDDGGDRNPFSSEDAQERDNDPWEVTRDPMDFDDNTTLEVRHIHTGEKRTITMKQLRDRSWQ